MQTIPWEKIKALEDEIKALKSLGKKTSTNKKPAYLKRDPLKGILKDVNISDEEFEKAFREAKKSLFPYDENIK